MRKIKKGDTVIVMTGRDRGRQGTVLSVLKSKTHCMDASRVLVENVNLIKKHTKANPQQEKAGGIIQKEASIAISNVAIFNAATGKADRVGFKILGDGRKVRVYKSTGEVVDHA
jgi:large subunit ribosomal protein L24